MLLRANEILIGKERQRREFDPAKLQELAEAIEKNSLLHPIVVRETAEGWKLVSGERRLRALQDHLWPLGGTLRHAGEVYEEGTVPAVSIGELDPLAAEEAELSENIHRDDLTWQERSAATDRLERLRRGQAADQGRPAPTVAAISEEVRGSSEGYHHEATRRELLVAPHLSDPEVRGAKTLDEAFKVLKRKEQTRKNTERAAEVGRTYTAEAHEARNEDCLSWMVHAGEEQFDVILTDPPYGIGADEFGDSGGRAATHFYEDSDEQFNRLLTVCRDELFRLAKPQAHLYWFCDIDRFHQCRESFERAGWWVHRTPLLWHKPNAPRVPWPEHGPQRKYELILYAVKGKRPVNRIAPDVLTHTADENLGHQAQKPVALFVDLLRRSVQAGDVVFDPFAGTGTIFAAADELKCRAVGVEQDPAAYGIALGRLEQLKLQGELL